MNFQLHFKPKTLLVSLALLALAISQSPLKAQNFKASALAGFNFSQIGGDNMAGFNHGGFAGGMRVYLPANEQWRLGMELLFSHRGSQISNDEPMKGNTSWDKLAVNYIDVPIIAKYRLAPKLSAYGGLGVGILVGGEVQQGGGSSDGDVEDALKTTDYFFQLGAGYQLSDRLEAMLRFQNSIVNFSETDTKISTGYGERFLWITGTYHTVMQAVLVYRLGRLEDD